jgi:hypothetical protein
LRLPWNFGEAVDPTFGIFASKTAGSDCPINVLNVGVQAAQLALAFGTTLAERGHGSRLYDFKKIKLSDGAGLWPGGHAKLFDSAPVWQRRLPLHRQDCDRIAVAVAVLDELAVPKATRARRCRQDDSDKGKKPAKKDFKHGTSSDRYLSRSAG